MTSIRKVITIVVVLIVVVGGGVIFYQNTRINKLSQADLNIGQKQEEILDKTDSISKVETKVPNNNLDTLKEVSNTISIGNFSISNIKVDKPAGLLTTKSTFNFSWDTRGSVPKSARVMFGLKRKSDGVEGSLWSYFGKPLTDGSGEFTLTCLYNCTKNPSLNNDQYLLTATLSYCEDDSRMDLGFCSSNTDGTDSGYKVITKDVTGSIVNRDTLIYNLDGFKIEQTQQ
jgi:hypothetical protein